VFIEKIRLLHFRNFIEAKLDLCPNVNILYGENAQGKTNFVEAISTALQGSSFRTTDVKNLINSPLSASAYVEILLQKNNLQHKVATQLSEQEKKNFLNEKKVAKSTIRREFSTVLFSPESLSVIKNSDLERRELIDELIESVFIQNRKSLENYRRLLKQRNTLLKDFRDNKYEINPRNVLYLETLTEQFLLCAAEVVEIRLTALQKMIPLLQQVLAEIFNESDVEIAVDYVISDQRYRDITRTDAFDAMYKRWLQLKSAEIKMGHSLVGPHKHDICLLFNEKDSRYYCSQGQQRLLILAFKMAQIGLHFDVHGSYPILLLDDVLSEIDEIKRHKLIEVLESLRAQIFITTTENTVLRYLNRSSYSVFEVKKGQINSKTGHQEELSVR
jgi:DNA replication and repair protein RecF